MSTNYNNTFQIAIVTFIFGWILLSAITYIPTANRWQTYAYPDGAFSSNSD